MTLPNNTGASIKIYNLPKNLRFLATLFYHLSAKVYSLIKIKVEQS